MQQPRPEHPRPTFQRERWECLNGPWSFAFDFGRSGAQRGYAASTGFAGEILVPFCPESPAGGVDHRDFIPAIWYHREIRVAEAWAGLRVLLHFGAVDFICEAFIDGERVGRHVGGSSSFTFDITRYVTPGQAHALVVHAIDDTRSHLQPGGKQSPDFYSRGCHYTRVTGIWQSVWLEAVHPAGLRTCRFLPDIDKTTCTFVPQFHSCDRQTTLGVRLLADGATVAEASAAAAPGAALQVPVPEARLWSPTDPFLYEVELTVRRDGEVLDRVRSHLGMRKVHVEGDEVFLNNKPLYQRLVLDQGFYKDGIWTAPSDAALKRDIELGLAAGFNGARLHQKVFEERFLYWADRLGYLVWAEYPSWGFAAADLGAQRNVLYEWSEIVERDQNHPSIIAWTPLNETHLPEHAGETRDAIIRLHHDVYDLTKRLDPTRPLNEASGYTHQKTDLWTVHTYVGEAEALKEQLTPTADGEVWRCRSDREVAYEGQPYLVDEFGGIRWVVMDETEHSSEAAWGYGESPTTLEDFYERLEGLVRVLDELPHVRGWCYTQLTDIEQEQNGIYNYDRSPKFEMERIRRIFAGG